MWLSAGQYFEHKCDRRKARELRDVEQKIDALVRERLVLHVLEFQSSLLLLLSIIMLIVTNLSTCISNYLIHVSQI